ncbi:MAG: insulinase family protein [Lysobacteraceae bacterium]|nr:MAG: insulinase family protein [Xanthomonadaceae bacterium]
MSIRSLAPLLGTLLLTFSLAAPVRAQPAAPPKGAVEVASVEGITEYRLENGLRVLLFPDATKPTVTVNLTYLVGSRHENYGETGMAHLLEHLLFKGTPDNDDIPGEMRRRGIRYNASTWVDRTNYFGSFAAGEDNLDWLLSLEADRMVNSHVRRADLDSEMTVVRNEMESGETNPVRVLLQRMSATAYLWHNYGKSTIGARSDVENMPIERLQAFYRTHYRPDNATLLVAGRIDPAQTLAKVVAAFGPLKRPAEPVQATYTQEPVQDGEREVVVRRVGDTRLIGLNYHLPAAAHPDSAPLEVLGQVLGDTPGGRLHKALVEPGLVTSVSASAWQLAEPGTMLMLAQLPRDGDDEAVAAELIKQVETATATPFTADEVAKAKTQLLKDAELLFNDANATATALSEAIASGDWRLFFLHRDRIEAVTADDVMRVAKAYLKPSNRTLARFIPTDAPDRAEIPATPDVAALVANYKGRAAVAAGEAFDPTPANIDSRTVVSKLANGTELALLAKQTRGDTVSISMALRFGGLDDVMDREGAASLAAAMLSRGTKSMSREQISRRLDDLKARLNINGSAQSVAVGASTTREHLPEVVALIAEMLKTPSFPETEFEQLRGQFITGIESQRSEPQSVVGLASRRHFGKQWPKGHPYYAATVEEALGDLRRVTLSELRTYHAAFYGAGNGDIAVVGDFDPAQVAALMQQHFGDWTSAKAFERIPMPVANAPVVVQMDETPDKANAVILQFAQFPVSDSHPDYAALVVANNIFGGGGMKSRLGDRVRQTDGLSYSVGSGFNAGIQDEAASQQLFAIAAPENIAKVKQAFAEEMARLVKDGVTGAELKDAVDGILKGRVLGRAEDGALAGQLRSNLYYDRTLAWSAELEAKMAALTKADVDAAIRRHFGTAGYSVFAAGDFAKVAAAQPEAATTP